MLSIIVAVYNAERYIKECVDSLIQQTYTDLEIILVNDGSSDNSYSIIKKMAEKDNRIIVINKENGGANSARYVGIYHSIGDYVFIMDADDYIEKNTIEILMNEIERENADIATCGVRKFFEDGRTEKITLRRTGIHIGKVLALSALDINRFFECNISLALYPYVFRKSLIDHYLEEIDKTIFFSEDRISWLAIYDANKVVIVDDYLYNYRMHEASITHRHEKSNFVSQKKLYSYFVEKLKCMDAEIIMWQQLEQFLIRDLLIGGYSEAFGGLDELYPFEGVEKGSKIVVYGAGAFGRELVNYIRNSENYELVAWADKNAIIPDEYLICPQEVATYEYDYLVVAVTVQRLLGSIRNELKRNHIFDSRVRFVDSSLISKKYINTSFFD